MSDQTPPVGDEQTKAEHKTQKQLFLLNELLGEWNTEAEAARRAHVNGTRRGAVTGFEQLDTQLSGVLRTGIHVVHGAPGVGKTAFVMQVAMQCQCPALIVTCEMSPLELLKRLTANVTKTSLRTLSSGELDIAESEEKALQAISKVPHLAILDCTQYSADTKLIQDSAHAVKSNFQDAAHFLIVIDSLHTWAKRLPECGNEYESLNYAINALQGLTHALKCPVVIISERNRENMKNEGQNSGAGTRSIEYGAETVIALDRDMTVAPGVSSEVEVRAKIVKNRNGSIEDAVLLKFRGEHMRFRESDGGRK